MYFNLTPYAAYKLLLNKLCLYIICPYKAFRKKVINKKTVKPVSLKNAESECIDNLQKSGDYFSISSILCDFPIISGRLN